MAAMRAMSSTLNISTMPSPPSSNWPPAVMRAVVMPFGTCGSCSGTPSSATFMYATQIGIDAFDANSPRPSDVKSSKPIQVVATSESLKPENHASRCSLVVPVLPARSLRPSSIAPRPVPRSTTSCMSEVMRNALRSSIARGASFTGTSWPATGVGAGAGVGVGAALPSSVERSCAVAPTGSAVAVSRSGQPRHARAGCSRNTTVPRSSSTRSMKYGSTR